MKSWNNLFFSHYGWRYLGRIFLFFSTVGFVSLEGVLVPKERTLLQRYTNPLYLLLRNLKLFINRKQQTKKKKKTDGSNLFIRVGLSNGQQNLELFSPIGVVRVYLTSRQTLHLLLVNASAILTLKDSDSACDLGKAKLPVSELRNNTRRDLTAA